jgi:hypothetical protein
MSPFQKPLMRLATAIHSHLASGGGERLQPLPEGLWERAQGLVRQVQRAQARGWRLAAGVLSEELRYVATRLEDEVAQYSRTLRRPASALRCARLVDIYQDLVALDTELEALDFSRQERWLSVTTEPIELEGVYLGPFEIRLRWTEPVDAPSYRVVALEPHPAATRDNVTHPHVLDEILCEGDGRVVIRRALAEGRLYDFFVLVASVLRSYNAQSPFVALEVWRGAECSDCGALVSDEERYVCNACGENLCEGCDILCDGCSDGFCMDCLARCVACDQFNCRGCAKRCGACGAALCGHCFTKNERCGDCHEKDSEDREEAVAVLADGLGQAALSA